MRRREPCEVGGTDSTLPVEPVRDEPPDAAQWPAHPFEGMMLTQSLGRTGTPTTSSWLKRPMSWLRPGGTRDGREAYQLRFLSGAILLASAVSVLALVAATTLGNVLAVAVIASYLVLILLQALAVRLGASVGVISWTIIATLGLFLLASALVPGSNQSGQLYWFLLAPLAARALAVPRHDAPTIPRSWRAEVIAGIVAMVGVALVIAYHAPRATVSATASPQAVYAVGLDVALFMLSALGLLYVHDLSVRETAMELRRLQELLSICAWCRKIEHDGRWVGLEHYVAQRQNAELTHGMCPTCYESYLPDGAHSHGATAAGDVRTLGIDPGAPR